MDLLWVGAEKIAGGLLGLAMVEVDRLVYVYWLRPEAVVSVDVKALIKQGRFKDAVRLLWSRKQEQKELVFRTVLAMVTWVPLAMFTLSSSGSNFAKGLMIGVGLRLVIDFWRGQMDDVQGLHNRLFWPIKRKVTDWERSWVGWAFTALFIGMVIVAL